MAWTAGLALAAGSLLMLAYINAHGAPQGKSFFDGVLQTATNAGVALVLAFVALTVGVWFFRQLWSEWLAWHPGGIDVGDFAAVSKLADADVSQLTMRFRQRLATLRLQAPTPVPGAAGATDFLDVLGSGGVESRNVLGSVLNLFHAAKPRPAWQINGILVERGESPRYGVTVQVIRLPNEGSPPETVWGRDWDDAVRCAADRATAAILPRTRLCRTPWATWRRFIMPGELLEGHEEAVELESARRYDEALGAYYRASAEDPSNLALRLHIGQLQEKMGLFLDALSTYQGILAIYKEGTEELRRRYRIVARSERRRTRLVARYRRNLLLGGSELIEQWRKTGPSDKADWDARDERRRELRDRLRPELKDELSAIQDRELNQQEKKLLFEPSSFDSTTQSKSDYEGRERKLLLELRHLFAGAALEDLKVVKRQARRRRRDRRLTLSPKSVELTRLCIAHRLKWIGYELTEEEPRPEWEPNPKEIDLEVAKIEGYRQFDRWEEHYNAACVYALPLMAPTAELASRQELEAGWRDPLAKRAVQRLRHAAACADSSFIAARRDWVLSEDPDLDGLRRHPRFKSFEAMYFPAAAPTAERPPHVQKLEISWYIRDLLLQTGERWEVTWHKRGRGLAGRPDIHTLLEWWTAECDAWDVVRNAAANHRHWSARLKLVNKMQAWSDTYGFEPLKVAFRRYEDDPLDDEARAASDETLQAADCRLRRAARALPCANGQVPREELREIARWQSTLRQLDAQGRGPSQLILAVLCDQHAALWQRFHEWIDSEGHEEERERELAFDRQMRQATRWWRRARHWWRTPVLLLTAAQRAVPGRRPESVSR